MEGDGATCRFDGAYLVAGDDEANIVTSVTMPQSAHHNRADQGSPPAAGMAPSRAG